MTDTLEFVDEQSLEDLGRYAARARAVDAEGGMRLQAAGGVLGAWVSNTPAGLSRGPGCAVELSDRDLPALAGSGN